MYIISIIEKIFESSFLINLFEDINVPRISYKLSQSYRHTNRSDKHLETEGVALSILFYILIEDREKQSFDKS